ncbi:MAG: hypothetical protein Fur0018_22040 [Anaerolineales bacterium]
MNPLRERIREALANPALQSALDKNAERRKMVRARAFASLPEAGRPLKRHAHAIRQETIANLDALLDTFIHQAQANGVRVHRAADAAEARRIVLDIVQRHNARLVAKSKSMVSEEIGLNAALEPAGVRVVETDLGEFIVQLRGEKPAHIITPAVHLRREDVGRTFAEKLDIPYTTDVAEMNAAARRTLREVFLRAEVGISGVNFGVAESGTLCIVTNEGNGRMVTTLPKVHIALMGMERLVPDFDALAVMLDLLPRSATGQKLSTYVSLLNRPRQPDDPDGPQERHLIILDNGREGLRNGGLREALLCIRCGACLNVCPTFREMGGHAYVGRAGQPTPYPGPIGSVVSPGLFGMADFGHLAKACSLCGACAEACPVEVPLPDLLLEVRREWVETRPPEARLPRQGMRAYAWVMTHPRVYHALQKIASLGMRLLPRKDGWVTWLPAPLDGWTKTRHFPVLDDGRRGTDCGAWTVDGGVPHAGSRSPHAPSPQAAPSDFFQRFSAEVAALDGEVIRCTPDSLGTALSDWLCAKWVRTVLVPPGEGLSTAVRAALQEAGLRLLEDALPADAPARQAHLEALAEADAGIAVAAAGLASTGTVLLTGEREHPQGSSLLPPVSAVILREGDIHRDLSAFLGTDGAQFIPQKSSVTLMSGPSRTADIEMTLTIGVHGPGVVGVFVV